MAGLAAGVIETGLVDHFLMRIVAGNAADAVVGSVVAAAVGQPVGLETYVGEAVRAVGGDLRPRAMALAAEVGHVLAGDLPEVGRVGFRRIGACECSQMFL